jgi:hypothetical protein
MQTISYPTYISKCALTDYTLDLRQSQRQDLPENITQHTDFTATQKHIYFIEWRREPVGLGLQLSYRNTMNLDVLFDEYSGYTQHSSTNSVFKWILANDAYLDTPQDVKQLQRVQDTVCYAKIQPGYILEINVLLP